MYQKQKLVVIRDTGILILIFSPTTTLQWDTRGKWVSTFHFRTIENRAIFALLCSTAFVSFSHYYFWIPQSLWGIKRFSPELHAFSFSRPFTQAVSFGRGCARGCGRGRGRGRSFFADIWSLWVTAIFSVVKNQLYSVRIVGGTIAYSRLFAV